MLREFFYFNKSDRKVILIVLLVTAICTGAFFLAGSGNGESNELVAADSITDQSYGDSSRHGRYQYHRGYRSHGGSSDRGGYYAVEGRKKERFYFDPNTADSTQLLRLGLQPWQVRNIYKYRAKGGIYRTPRDFAKLFGLTAKEFRELEPYIRISSDYAPAAEVYASADSHTASSASSDVSDADRTLRPRKLKEGETIPINSSDTAMLRRVPGIGSYFARNIVRYRERLGGFVSLSQLSEIDGLPPDVAKYFDIDGTAVRKINVNKLSIDQLRRHPYINYYQAKAIAEYRRMHGPLKSLQQLSLLRDFPEEEILRLEPYVEY